MIQEHTSKQIFSYQHLEHAPLPVIVLAGPEMSFHFANEHALSLFKVRVDNAVRKPVSEVLPEMFDKSVIQKIYENCFLKAQACLLEEKQVVHSRDANLQISWFNVKCSPMQDEHGRVVGVVAFFSDISEKINSRKSMVNREDYLVSFFKQAPIGLVCYRGSGFIVDFANDKALEMWGKSVEEVKGKPIQEIFPEVLIDPEINARHNESVQRLKRGETHIANEVELTFLKDGKPRTGWYTYIHEPYTNEAGEIIGMMAIAIEVTGQVIARKKLQLVTDAIPSLVSYINVNEEYELVNQAYETWFGRSRETVVGKTIAEVVGKEGYPKVKPHVDKVLAGHTDNFESWIDYADGKRRFVSANYIPHVDSNNNVLGYIGLINDLTDRKKHEEALVENEAQLRLIIEGVSAGTFEYELTSGHIKWSDELKALLGLPKDSLIDSDTAHSVVHPDDLPLVLHQSNELRVERNGYMAVDYRIIRKDNGEIRWLHSRSKVFFNEIDGKHVPSRIIGFSIDVTEQKLAEEKLKELSQNLEVKVRERTSEVTRINDLLSLRNEELNKTQSVLQQLIDSSIEYIAVIDRDLKFLALNRAFETFVHKSRSELIGKEIFDAYDGARGSKQVELLAKSLAGETIHLKSNPSISRPNVWFDTHYVPLVINNQVEGVIVLSRDITDIIKSEQELANINRQLQEAQRLSKLGSWEWDVSSGTVLWSDEMYHIYGYEEKFPVDFVKATERMSREDADRSSKRTQQYIQQAIERFRSIGETVYHVPSSEIRIQLPNGENKLLRNTGKIQLTSEGKLHRFLGVLQDVTQIRSTEERLKKLVDELETKNRELESFNYVASHDLKEPLRSIRTMIDMVRRKGDQNGTYLSKIDRAAARMSDLIESILKLSEASNVEIEFTDVDLNKALESCKNDLESRIKETDAKIVNEQLPIVKANESQITQVFSNLLGNSLKFCKTAPIVEIKCAKIRAADMGRSISDSKTHEYWCITFADNGIGFDSKLKDQIFEPFQRLHGRSDYSGTGIGLSIVKKIIERHHGFIDVESAVGIGSKFILWLPVSV